MSIQLQITKHVYIYYLRINVQYIYPQSIVSIDNISRKKQLQKVELPHLHIRHS